MPLNPMNSFFCEAIEGNDGLFDVLALRVFCAIVTQSIERLHEDHDGGDADARDFCRVVQRAGRKLLGNPGGLKDCFFA